MREFEQTFRDNAIDGTELLGLDSQMLADDLGISKSCVQNGMDKCMDEIMLEFQNFRFKLAGGHERRQINRQSTYS